MKTFPFGTRAAPRPSGRPLPRAVDLHPKSPPNATPRGEPLACVGTAPHRPPPGQTPYPRLISQTTTTTSPKTKAGGPRCRCAGALPPDPTSNPNPQKPGVPLEAGAGALLDTLLDTTMDARTQRWMQIRQSNSQHSHKNLRCSRMTSSLRFRVPFSVSLPLPIPPPPLLRRKGWLPPLPSYPRTIAPPPCAMICTRPTRSAGAARTHLRGLRRHGRRGTGALQVQRQGRDRGGGHDPQQLQQRLRGGARKAAPHATPQGLVPRRQQGRISRRGGGGGLLH